MHLKYVLISLHSGLCFVLNGTLCTIFYVRLTFECRSSPNIFDTISQAVCYIAERNYKVKHILHLLDDFLTTDHPDDDGERTMALMMTIFKRLNIPIAKHKTLGPVIRLEYLGIILNSEKNGS